MRGEHRADNPDAYDNYGIIPACAGSTHALFG